jgi:hypothetical protein
VQSGGNIGGKSAERRLTNGTVDVGEFVIVAIPIEKKGCDEGS